jgi:hypothetical protein
MNKRELIDETRKAIESLLGDNAKTALVVGAVCRLLAQALGPRLDCHLPFQTLTATDLEHLYNALRYSASHNANGTEREMLRLASIVAGELTL